MKAIHQSLFVLYALLCQLAAALPAANVLAASQPQAAYARTTPQIRLPAGGPTFMARESLNHILGASNRAAQIADDSYGSIANDMMRGNVRLAAIPAASGYRYPIVAAAFRGRPIPVAVVNQNQTAAVVSTTSANILPTLTSSVALSNTAAASKTTTSLAPGATQTRIATPCVGSEGNDTYISSLFHYGGAGTTVYLCPNANITLTNAIFFTAANQTLATLGLPTDNTRATLTVTGPTQACAVFALGYAHVDGTVLRNVIIDGGRQRLGRLADGMALIEMGGSSVNQQILYVKAFEPRGWSALHAIEGTNLSCNGMTIANNEIGPSGHAPSGAQQFRKRDSTGTYGPGEWADGISLACKNSQVTNNVIRDATDGGIVIFGAPGSMVTKNQIISSDRQLLGGINMVDWGPFSGSFTGTVVQGNIISSQGAMIKLGVAMGGMTWGVDNRTIARTFGGSVLNNRFTTSATGYFGYAIGVAGHENATISGNSAVGANFGGVSSPSCFPQFPLLPFQPFVADRWTTPGVKFQANFSFSTLVLLICSGPGAIVMRASKWR